jgi:histidine ammonia-lyase
LKHSQLRDFLQQPSSVSIDGDGWAAVEASRETVSRVIAAGKTVYGLNTGFGMLANQKISLENLARLQVNLVRSHAAGCGELLSDAVVRLVMLLKATSLARGYSGVRREVIELLLGMLNADVLPCIPGQGSVGASGDLAPLAHMSLAMIGEGRVRVAGEEEDSQDALARHGLSPIELGPKEGLALLNGTQVSTALALAGLYAAEHCLTAGILTGAMSVDAVMGSDTPFDARIHAIRNHPAQDDCARWFRTILAGSEIRESHRECTRVQDPYSLRCQPQVMGACLEALRHAADVLLREANAVSDNPLVFGDDDAILSGGNFHAEPVAMAADQIAVALAEIGALSERRIALLIDQHLSGLPAFLVKEGGLNSGFMIPQVTAAALASENKHFASPVSVDSLPTSANQEDHVSMATYAARRLEPMARNTSMILAIELLAACQGIDFRAPLRTSPTLQELHQRVRSLVPHYDTDRVFADDMRKVSEQVVMDVALAAAFDGTVIA